MKLIHKLMIYLIICLPILAFDRWLRNVGFPIWPTGVLSCLYLIEKIDEVIE